MRNLSLLISFLLVWWKHFQSFSKEKFLYCKAPFPKTVLGNPLSTLKDPSKCRCPPPSPAAYKSPHQIPKRTIAMHSRPFPFLK